MLKQHANALRKLMIFIDLGIVTGAFFLAYFLRFKPEGLHSLNHYLWILPLFLSLWGSLLYSMGMYTSFRLKSILEILFIIIKAAFFGFIVLTSLGYLLKVHYVSRMLIIFLFILAALFLSTEKIILMQFFWYLRKKGFNFKNLLIVGTGPRAQDFIKNINRNREFGLNIIGIVDKDINKVGQIIQNHEVIGTFSDLPKIIQNNILDHVLFIVPRSMLEKIEEQILYCETTGVTVSIAVDLFNLQFTKAKEESILDLPVITFKSVSDKLWNLLIKRSIDIIISVTTLILLLPVLAITALVIKITSKGPIFFKQERCSSNGRKFIIYKFRTMVKDAEDRLKDLHTHNEMEGPVFKMKNDPRLTKTGKFIRKFSIDELPQLWNVFKGDMSLVGPRPPIPHEVQQYDHWQRRRLSMKPGLTCLWQINGRNEVTDFDEWMKLDLKYIDNWSLLLDLKILFKTIPAVLSARGAK